VRRPRRPARANRWESVVRAGAGSCSDPEGFEGEVNCFDATYDPSTVRDEDEIVDSTWLERTKRVPRADDQTLPPRQFGSNSSAST
jgi:hypothetical protein